LGRLEKKSRKKSRKKIRKRVDETSSEKTEHHGGDADDAHD
jgi:hypothetical protein